ncbi:MAG: glycerophosphodiester phosphodiesterase family protein [Peptostreptococcaceae bacterium]
MLKKLDKKFILTANLTSSEIDYPKNIKFYNLDKNIANLYLKLEKNDEYGVKSYIQKEEAKDYNILLTVIKPKTKLIKKMDGIITTDIEDGNNAIWKFELSPEFTDQVGTVVAEIRVSSDDEELIIDPFRYTIKASAVTSLNIEIEGNPDLPLLEQLIKEIQKVNYIDDENVSKTRTFSSDYINSKIQKVVHDLDIMEPKVNSLASGSPKGVYPTITALKNTFPTGNNNIYVVSSDGGWYYWNSTTWTKGGTYQSTAVGEETVAFNSFNTHLKTQANKVFKNTIIPNFDGKFYIDVDASNKKIIISEVQPAAHVIHGLRGSQNVGFLPSTELDYSSFTSSAMSVCLDLSTEKYVLREYGKTIGENEVVLCGVRTNGGSDSYFVTMKNGRPNSIFQSIMDRGLTTSKYYGKTIRRTDLTSSSHYFYWDVENKTVTIPKGEFMYGHTPVGVSESYTISYSGTTTLWALIYNVTTSKFEVVGYNGIINHNDTVLLYDLVRIAGHTCIGFYTEDIIFSNSDNMKYRALEDLCNFEDTVVFPGGAYTRTVIGDVMMVKASGHGISSNSRFGLSRKNKQGLYSDCARITDKDRINSIKVKVNNPNYYVALHFHYINEEGKVTVALDSGWKTSNNTPATINIKELVLQYGTLYVTPYFRFSDDSVHSTSEFENPSVDITVQYIDKENNDLISEPTIPLDPSVVRLYRNTPNNLRLYLDIDLPMTAFQTFKFYSPVKVSYEGIEFHFNYALHGYDKNGSKIYDSNYRGANTWQHNPIIGHPNAYDGTLDLPSVVSRFSYVKVYASIWVSQADYKFPNEETLQHIVSLLGIKYDLRNFVQSDLDDMDKDTIYKHLVKDTYLSDSNSQSVVALDDEIILDSSTNATFETITIPQGYNYYEVEFTTKVSGGEGFLQFENDQHKFSIKNTNYKTFKMRLNKSDLVSSTVNIIPTIPSGETLSVKNIKITPVLGRVNVRDHNKAKFYTHRAYSYIYPENTVMALQQACERGASIVELDLFTSTDGKALIIHDNNLGRTNKARPTITMPNPEHFSISSDSLNKVTISNSSSLSEFEVNDDIELTINETNYTRRVTSIDASSKILTLNSNIVAGVPTRVVNHRRNVATCSEVDFLSYEVGEFKNKAFKGEMNAPFDDYIKVASQYGTAILFDIRSMSEQCFKNHIAPLLDYYDYWEHTYFMSGYGNFNTYNTWANQINRHMRVVHISWSNGATLTNEINALNGFDFTNISTIDIAIERNNVTKEHVDFAHSYAFRVMAYTVNDLHSATGAMELFRKGVDIVGSDLFTDDRCILW